MKLYTIIINDKNPAEGCASSVECSHKILAPSSKIAIQEFKEAYNFKDTKSWYITTKERDEE